MKSQIFLNYVIISLVSLSYVIGFYVNEDSAGGGEIDLINHEWGNYLLFKENTLINALQSLEYQSSRTPLFLIFHKYNIFINDVNDLRFFSFLLGIISFLLFYYCLKIIFKKTERSILLLISSFILLSPYFRTSSYWANQEHLSILFFIISLIFFNFCIDNKYKFNEIKYYINSILCSLFCFLTFYVDQKFFFMSIIVYFYLIRKTSVSFFLTFSSINFLFFLPSLFLFYLWGGLVPIESQSRLAITPSNINILISNIGIYFLPIISAYFYKNEFKLPSLNKQEIIILILIACLLFILLPENASREGSGIVFRLLSLIYLKNFISLNWEAFQLFYLVINIFFSYLLIVFVERNFKNFVIIFSFILIYYFTSFSYQSYVDPVYLILIYAFMDLKNIKISNKEVVYVNLIFLIFVLTSSIFVRNFIL